MGRNDNRRTAKMKRKKNQCKKKARIRRRIEGTSGSVVAK